MTQSRPSPALRLVSQVSRNAKLHTRKAWRIGIALMWFLGYPSSGLHEALERCLDLQDMAATCWKYTCITWSHTRTCQQSSMFGTVTTHFFEVQTMLGWSQSVYDEIGGTGSRQCWWLFQMLAVAVADSWTPPVLCLPVTRKATEYFDTGEGAIKLRRAHLENVTPGLIGPGWFTSTNK
jgi:hypothetical protein